MKKELGQVWTPQWMVERMLDSIELSSNELNDESKKFKILEPSFGNGVFLKELIHRISKSLKNTNKSDNEILKFINDSLYGVEFEKDTYISTMNQLKNLMHLLLPNADITEFLPNLVNEDFLEYSVNIDEKFSHIVGNPPYVRVHDMPVTVREQLKRLSTTTGITDLYIAFYEQSYKLLDSHGELIFIAPNSWQKNTSQKFFRSQLITNKSIISIEDYGHHQVFNDASTYVSVVKLSKLQNISFVVDEVELSKNDSKNDVVILDSNTIFYNEINDPSESLTQIIDQVTDNHDNYITLGEICDIQNGVVTMRDSVFILNDISQFSEDDMKYIRPCIKGSTYTGTENKYAIFPYKTENNRTISISEEELKSAPGIYDYLTKCKEDLERRSSEKNALWFHYGRSQAILKTNFRKLVISNIVAPDASMRSYFLNPGTLVYSGLFIIEKEVNGKTVPLEDIQKIIESEDFTNYIKRHGKNMRGNYSSFGVPLAKSFKVIKS